MPFSFPKNKLNLTVVLLCLLLAVLRFINLPVEILSWDVFGYYLYLPATFIHQDSALQNTAWLDELMRLYEPSGTLYQLYAMPAGKMLIKYTSGIAMLTLPFFLLGHLIALLAGFPADGLSLPYQLSMAAGGLVYAFVGLFYFKRILEHFFDGKIALLLLLLVFFGTNYLQVVAFDGTLLAHNFLFTFYAILVYYTIKWHEKATNTSAVMIGVSFGFISLLRPTEAVIALFPLLYNVFDLNSLKIKMQQLRANFSQLLLLVFIVLIIWIPQLIYWKQVTGQYFYYTYQNAGEGLDFLSPHTLDFLFSFRKGWLVYTPMMLFALLGFIFLFQKNRSLFYAVFLFTALDIYVISSWTCWWYAGGSFSARAIVPAYILLAFPLGYFLIWVEQKTKFIKAIFSILFLLLIVLNLFQTWQFENGIISKQRMTRAYYMAIFGNTEVPEGAEKLLLVNRPEDGEYVFDNEEEYNSYVLFPSKENNQIMNKETLYSKTVERKYRELTSKDHAWIRVKAKLISDSSNTGQRLYLVASFHHDGEPYAYRAKEIELPKGEWINFQFDYLTPEVRSASDNLKIYFWNKDRMNRVEIKDLEVIVFEKKMIL